MNLGEWWKTPRTHKKKKEKKNVEQCRKEENTGYFKWRGKDKEDATPKKERIPLVPEIETPESCLAWNSVDGWNSLRADE